MNQSFTMVRHAIDGIPAFLRVAECGSFRAAAAEMGISPSALSQTIKSLEARLGVTLLHRTTRSVGLTEAGQRLFDRAYPAMDGFEEAIEAARSLSGRPAGLLRINASRGAITGLLEPVLDSFFRAHPEIELELFADDDQTDIVARGFDAGIRMGESLMADMVAVRVSPPYRYAVYGSPGYLERYGRPCHPTDLEAHRCIRVRFSASRAMHRWEFVDGDRTFRVAVHGPLIVNDSSIRTAAAINGIGLAYGAQPLIEPLVKQGRIETVLDQYMPSTPGLFVYYPSRKQAMPKLRAFVDHLRRVLHEELAKENSRSTQ